MPSHVSSQQPPLGSSGPSRPQSHAPELWACTEPHLVLHSFPLLGGKSLGWGVHCGWWGPPGLKPHSGWVGISPVQGLHTSRCAPTLLWDGMLAVGISLASDGDPGLLSWALARQGPCKKPVLMETWPGTQRRGCHLTCVLCTGGRASGWQGPGTVGGAAAPGSGVEGGSGCAPGNRGLQRESECRPTACGFQVAGVRWESPTGSSLPSPPHPHPTPPPAAPPGHPEPHLVLPTERRLGSVGLPAGLRRESWAT